ncbi:MAG: thioredoxin family protein [Candidatus Hydrogenedentes bacterium]|nr:thioredoxin family protein [Candidatus Hydrogenedentota bacterium]
MIIQCLLGIVALYSTGAAEAPSPTVTPVFETDAAHAGTPIGAAVQVAFGEGWHVNAHKPNDEYLIPTDLKLSPGPGMTVRDIAYPEPVKIVLEGANETLATYGPAFAIGVVIDIAADVKPGDYNVQGALQYQACDKKQCYPPNTLPVILPIKVVPSSQALVSHPIEVPKSTIKNTITSTGTSTSTTTQSPKPQTLNPETGAWRLLADSFAVVGDASGYMNASDFIAFLDNAESGRGAAGNNPLANKAGWLVALFALTGGLLLNFTPCVLPLIPINLGIIGAGVKAGSRSRGFLLGGAYGAGIALTYGVLGLVVILGVSKTFGAINATPWFNAAIAVIFIALALAMFDVYLIDFTRFQTRLGIKKREGGSFVTAVLMGAVSALLAGACVAPVIISTIVYAQDRYANGIWAALFLPFLVGIGMALPWPLAGAGLSFLPKPGAWMVRVKYAFGVLILLFAAYYAHLAYGLMREQHAASGQELAGWTPSLAEGLAQAQPEKKPVLIDFWATWCKNCITMDATTFRNPQVQAHLANYVRIKFQAEHPGDPATREAMEHFEIVGLPTYVVLKPK